MPKILDTSRLLIMVLSFSLGMLFLGALPSSEVPLYNGIRLPEQWPPNYGALTREPMKVPYLKNPPAVIPIDVGRQLLVDDFLIESTTLKRTFHQPEHYPGNPILKPDKPWELEGPAPFAAPFSGGVWYDPKDRLFKMWYTGGYIRYTCYATSKDGIHWDKPSLDVVPGTNIVLDHAVGREKVYDQRPWMEREKRPLDTNSVWIDSHEKDPKRRYKNYYTTWRSDKPGDWLLALRCSADGMHWSEEMAISSRVGDHTNAHYNPFRKLWVINIRTYSSGSPRARSYLEHADAAVATKQASEEIRPGIVPWLAADRLDPHNPNPQRSHIEPQLYHFDAIAYESLMLGFFSIWQGPTNEECGKLNIPKRNEILISYSRDGFHFDRPDRRPFIGVNENDPHAWNWGNVQSSSGGCLVVGDKLYIYFSGRSLDSSQKTFWDGNVSTGLAILRRDGFASMDSSKEEGQLTTRPVQFKGKHLFVNVDNDQGELSVEVLDKSGRAIAPFTRENCIPVSVDGTLQQVIWKGAEDLSAVARRPVRFRFYLRLGSLYSFWVSPDTSGASHGYVAAGGPGFPGAIDTVGQKTSN